MSDRIPSGEDECLFQCSKLDDFPGCRREVKFSREVGPTTFSFPRHLLKPPLLRGVTGKVTGSLFSGVRVSPPKNEVILLMGQKSGVYQLLW